jgi:acetylornithine deacetylase/succinyl-diaminopimelate desuccinylase-like protein
MVGALAEALPAPADTLLARLLDPAQTDAALDEMRAQGLGQARGLDAQLHHTLNATVVRGGLKTNVIPSAIEVELDGRVLPGYTAGDFLAEVKTLLGDDLELEILRHDSGRPEVDMHLFSLLAELVKEADPEGVPIPALVGGFTDGRMFARLGIQNYGFLPQPLPAEFTGLGLVHGADERVPVEAIDFGTRILYRLLERYRG